MGIFRIDTAIFATGTFMAMAAEIGYVRAVGLICLARMYEEEYGEVIDFKYVKNLEGHDVLIKYGLLDTSEGTFCSFRLTLLSDKEVQNG